mmetsp:Transcript_145933/g.254612  ORF Transcript_145933/g.254612 Transcript_145933/m.254612 type:complete len:414 (-) Transcript_145933:45-1286(-)
MVKRKCRVLSPIKFNTDTEPAGGAWPAPRPGHGHAPATWPAPRPRALRSEPPRPRSEPPRPRASRSEPARKGWQTLGHRWWQDPESEGDPDAMVFNMSESAGDSALTCVAPDSGREPFVYFEPWEREDTEILHTNAFCLICAREPENGTVKLGRQRAQMPCKSVDGLSRDELIRKIIDLRYACHDIASQAETVKEEIACLQKEHKSSTELLGTLRSTLDAMSRQRADQTTVPLGSVADASINTDDELDVPDELSLAQASPAPRTSLAVAQAPGDSPPNKSLPVIARSQCNNLRLDDDRPGEYKTMIKIRVSDRCSLGGKEVANLPKDTIVRVLEVVRMPEIHRVRARIQEPEGWISLLGLDDGFRGVVRVDEVGSKSDDSPTDEGEREMTTELSLDDLLCLHVHVNTLTLASI